MFARVLAVVLRKPAIWGPAVACATLLALVPALAGILGAVPLVALVLTWDSEVALNLMPDFSGSTVAALVLLATIGLVAWRRLDAVLIYMTGVRSGSAWEATSVSWVRVGLLHVEAAIATALGAGALALLVLAGGGAIRGMEAVLLFAMVLLLRTIIRVYLTLAARYVIFEGAEIHDAWRKARALVRAEKAQVVMAWLTLAAAGVSIWVIGPLAMPIVRDTAFDYPAASGYTVAWEGGRLLLGVPFEALLLIVSAVLWTSVAWQPRLEPTTVKLDGPWRIRLLSGATILVVLANGSATIIDVQHQTEQERLNGALEITEIRPEDAERSAATPGATASQTYEVDALIDGNQLTWTTTLTYRNTTGVPLDDIVLNVWAAAYARDLEDIPLGSDLLAVDVDGTFASEARPGTLDVTSVVVANSPTTFELDDTALQISLGSGLQPGGTVEIEVALEARLPEFPERFGRWDRMILLGNWIPTVAPYTTGWRRDTFGDVGDPFVSIPSDYTIKIAVDESLGVVGSGNLTDISAAGGGRRVWVFDAPQSRDAAFAIGPFLRGQELTGKGTTLRCWYPADGRSGVWVDCLHARDALDSFTKEYGALPFDELDIVETSGVLGGMEYPGVLFVSRHPGGLGGVPLLGELYAYAGFDLAVSKHVLAHEIAHQWWYAVVGNDQVEEPFLDEALAEASARLWIDQTTWEMANLTAGIAPNRSSLRASISDFKTNEDYLKTVYQGGSELLLRLRGRVGADTFREVLRRWYLTQYLSQGTVSEFLELVEAVAGEEALDYLVPD